MGDAEQVRSVLRRVQDALDNVRIMTFFAGEHEARIIDPRRVEVVQTHGQGGLGSTPLSPDADELVFAVIATARDPMRPYCTTLDERPSWPMLWHMPTNESPSESRRASLFRNGRNQALRIPKVFELPGDEVMVHREGNRLIIEPIPKKRGLLETLAELQPLDEELPDVDEALPPLDDIDLDQ